MPPKRVKATPPLPPPPIVEDQREVELTKIRNLLEKRLISAEVAEQMTRQALGLPAPPPVDPPQAPKHGTKLEVEDGGSTFERITGSWVREWSGTPDAPCIQGELHLYFLGMAPNALLNERIETFKYESELNRAITALFTNCRKGEVPPGLAGDAPAVVCARLAVRQYLGRLLLLCGVECIAAAHRNVTKQALSPELRALAQKSLESQVNQETHVRTGMLLMGVIGKSQSTIQAFEKAEGKRAREPMRRQWCGMCRMSNHDTADCRKKNTPHTHQPFPVKKEGK